MAGFLPNAQDDTGLFVPTTDVYELSRIAEVDVNSEEFKLLLIRLYQNLNNIALSLNIKDSAYYVTNQFLNGQLFFPDAGTFLGTTNGAGNASGTVPFGSYQRGDKFVIGAETDTVTSILPGAQPMTSTGPSVTHTFNITNGAYNFVGAPANTAIMFTPLSFDATQDYRQAYRVVVNVGNLPAGIKTVAHSITIPNPNSWTFTRIYGTATDNVGNNYYPIPFAGAAGAYISLVANLTNVVINNASGVTFNKCLVILEFLKS